MDQMPTSRGTRSEWRLLADTSQSFTEICSFVESRRLEVEGNLQRFCDRLRAWCFIIRNTTRESDSELTTATLKRFELLLSNSTTKNLPYNYFKGLGRFAFWSQKPIDHQRPQEVTAAPYPTLLRFNEEWRRRCHGNDEAAKLQFVKKSLGYGSSLKEQDEDELFAVLGKWQALARDAPKQDSLSTERDGWDSPSSTQKVAPPSFKLSATARSIFQALQDSANCGQQCHRCQGGELLARMRVATQRRSSDLNNAHGEAFILILVDNNMAQITEVRVRSNKVTFQPSYPVEETIPINAGPLCQKLRSVHSRRLQRLELILDPRGTNLKIDRPQHRTFLEHETENPMTLERLLDLSHIEDRHKYILAVLLSYAVLHLYDTPWLQATLSPSDIFFLPTRSSSSKYYLTPFLKKQLRPIEDIDSWECVDIDFPDWHPVPTFVVLAATLMEVYTKQSFRELATTYCGTEGGPDSIERTEVLDVAQLFEAMREKKVFDDDTRFAKSIEACLDMQLWREESESGQVLSDTKLREKFYSIVVRQLEEHLCMVDNTISIEELDTMAEAIHMDLLGLRSPAENVGSELSYDDSEEQDTSAGGATTDPGFECFDGTDECDLNRYAGQTSALLYTSLPTYPRYFDCAHSYELTPGTRTRHTQYKKWKKCYKRVQRRLFPDPCTTSRPVRIAVLDTGLDLDHEGIMAERIVQKRNWVDPNRRDDIEDHDGHGTFVAGLLLEYAPDAELCVGKVCDADAPSQCRLAKAIDWAIKEWKVDIISISLGWPRREMGKCKPGTCGDPKECKILHETIRDAKDVLIFAAARNGGANQGVAYPASDSNVICIYSVDADGQKSRFSPNASHKPSIATVGGGVKSLWPGSLFPPDRDLNLKMIKHKSGTSFATPIAVGMAATLMQYGRLHLDPADAKHMKVKDKMVQVLEEIARSNEGRARRCDDYTYVHFGDDPDNFFGHPVGDDEGFHYGVKQLLRKRF
ncbi:hypothetical protein RB598_000278 [Gaeumannomyces tritici]